MNDWILSLVTAAFLFLNRPDINIVVEEAKCYPYIILSFFIIRPRSRSKIILIVPNEMIFYFLPGIK